MWVTDPLCLADAIAQNFQGGEQIICISMTTEQLSYSRKAIPEGAKVIPGHTKTVWCPHDEQLPFDGKKNRDAVMVEVFFERPLRGPRERFVYNLATVPVTIMHDDRYLGLSSIFCDWSGHFNQYLNKGWKLVDIFVDFRRPPEDVESLVMNQFQYTYGSGDDEVTVKTREPINTDTLWLFEKPASREHDPTPVYEGQIVSFAFDAPSGGRNPTVYWDNVIRDMGQRGVVP
nr:hypothetical protein BaRGS_005109 [Batillaria attramentaria]